MEYIEDIKEEAEHRAAKAFSTLFKGISALASLGAVVRYFDRHHYINPARMLGWMGLGRRRSMMGSIALLGAGALAGAGIAMFISPRSGRDTRQGVVRGVQSLRRKGRDLLHSAREGMREISEGDSGKEGQEARRGEQRGEERQGGMSGGARPGGVPGSEAGGRPGGVNVTTTR